jgi:transcription initiation factor TFIID subunit 8
MCDRSDGFGAQFQTIIQSILITECNNKTYLHNTIKNIEHNYEYDSVFLNKIEDLMNLKDNFELAENNSDKNINILDFSVISIFENNIDFYMESESLKNLRNIFWKNKIKKFDTNKLNISIHVRRQNIHDNRIEGADTPDKYYLDVIRHLRQLYYNKDILFHIYSQGNIDNFKIYENDDVVLHIDENIFYTFIGLVEADILVMSASSFSYSAGLLNDGIVYYLPFWHKPCKNWITLSYYLNLGNFINNTDEFTYDDSLRLNKSRIIHLDSLNFNFKYKKILETGCGARGDITNYLLKKYADITLNDVREDNIKSLLNNLNIILPYNTWNLNNNIDENKLFDIIICYGLLYHLTDPENCIRHLSNLCKEYCIISTCTNGKNDESINVLFENDLCMQGFEGYGCRPGRLFIYNTLIKYFKYVYMLTTQPNDIDYPLNFPSEHSSSKNIFIGSHIELNNENLINYLPNTYKLK